MRLAETAREVNQALAEYKFNDAASLLYAFTWHNFCDWYIELIKDDLYGEEPARQGAGPGPSSSPSSNSCCACCTR